MGGIPAAQARSIPRLRAKGTTADVPCLLLRVSLEQKPIGAHRKPPRLMAENRVVIHWSHDDGSATVFLDDCGKASSRRAHGPKYAQWLSALLQGGILTPSRDTGDNFIIGYWRRAYPLLKNCRVSCNHDAQPGDDVVAGVSESDLRAPGLCQQAPPAISLLGVRNQHENRFCGSPTFIPTRPVITVRISLTVASGCWTW